MQHHNPLHQRRHCYKRRQILATVSYDNAVPTQSLRGSCSSANRTSPTCTAHNAWMAHLAAWQVLLRLAMSMRCITRAMPSVYLELWRVLARLARRFAPPMCSDATAFRAARTFAEITVGNHPRKKMQC